MDVQVSGLSLEIHFHDYVAKNKQFYLICHYCLIFISIPSNYDEDVRDSIGSALATKLIIPFCQGDIPRSKYVFNTLALDYIIVF